MARIIGGLQRARHDVKAFVGHRGRRIGDRQETTVGFHDLAARVKQLAEQHRAVCMHRLGDAAIPRYAAVVGRHQHVIGVAGGFVHAGDLQHDEADAAPRPRLLIRHQRVVDRAVGRQGGVVAGGHDPVLERRAAEGERLE